MVKSWREEQIFQAIYVSERFLEEFGLKMVKAKVRNKAALFLSLLSGWIQKKYQLPKEIPGYVTSWGAEGGVGLSLYYPKSLDGDLGKRMDQIKSEYKAEVFRALLYGWTNGDIQVTLNSKKKEVLFCRSVGVAITNVADKRLKSKAADIGLSKSGAVVKILEKWSSSSMAIKISNSDVDSHKEDHCFGIMLPTKVDDLVEKKMKKNKLTNKRIVIRKLVDMYLEGRITI